MTTYHLSCNQLDHVWEVRNNKNIVLYTGQYWECKIFLKLMENDEI